ncbi:hypothetical protein PHLGIDRAFT_377944 [Phlebiopsis gigantea 11061_1 CR5-6]|uniref:Major facilitator superfamily (MFS) profile domain-containing protein n=1 Tax=Phlebiopsis gigantea (strain 11061_1 CR5-6) TaxID=745531 RepID=A0A0C3PNP4_PHLG1|nr:hypothetical protein PHLGIDRAFT_377944 [Phlebiopsis gigantea 11061_1 CR5-6]
MTRRLIYWLYKSTQVRFKRRSSFSIFVMTVESFSVGVRQDDAAGTSAVVLQPVPSGAVSLEDDEDEKTSMKTVMTPPHHGLTDQTNFLPARQVFVIFCGLSVALACAFLDQTIISTALPRIASDFHSGRESSWVATAYLLTSLSCSPLYGRFSDIFGRKILLLVALCIFIIFSLGCALAQSMIQLIVFRALQGVGGGAITTLVLIIMSDIVSLKERATYQGVTETVIALAQGFGPVIGGLFAEYTTWRWTFWINLPLGGLALGVCLWLLPLKKVDGEIRHKLLQIDYVGSLLTITASVLLLLGLTWGGVTYSWSSAAVLVPLILGIALFALFLVWEGKFAKLPLVPIRVLKNRTVAGVCISNFMNGMTFFAILYYIPQLLELVKGYSPVKASLLFLPFLCPISVVVFCSGQYCSRTGRYRPLIVFGYGLWTVAQGLQCTIDEHSSLGKIIGFLLITAFASGFTFQTALLAAQAAVPRHDMAVVTGMTGFVRTIGSTISLAICASLVNNTLRGAVAQLGLSAAQVDALVDDPTIVNHLDRLSLDDAQKAAVIAGYTKGFKRVFYMTVACMGVAFFACLFMVEQHELVREDDEELKRQAKEELDLKKRAERDVKSDAVSEIPALEKV